ncbi:UNVERIFIED_CONTAM: hypothetical protein HDU68_010742 [Siphonaria sp. JEL0065]|nr:hypothetical protein HDU68_010742 [Siphonaria sp. JEL0065]
MDHATIPLPQEVVEEIVLHLPVNCHLTSVAFASKEVFARLILHSLPFARRHLLKVDYTKIATFDVQDEESVRVLPLTYQSFILGRDLSVLCTDCLEGKGKEMEGSETGEEEMEDSEVESENEMEYSEAGSEGVFEVGSEDEMEYSGSEGVFEWDYESEEDYSSASQQGENGYGTRLNQYDFGSKFCFDLDGWDMPSSTASLLFSYLLSNPHYFDPTCQNNMLLRLSVERNYATVVEMLLADARIDLSTHNVGSQALCIACQTGSFEIARLLLSHPYVDPCYCDNLPLVLASKFGHSRIVDALLATGKVEANSSAILVASTHGHADIVATLLRILPDFDKAAASGSRAVVAAVDGGFMETVRVLLDFKFGDPAAFKNRAVISASRLGYTEIVKLLLCHPKVDPSTDNNYAIRQAAANGHTKIVKLFLAIPSVNPFAENNEAFLYACRNSHAKVVKLLATHPNFMICPSLANDAFIFASANGHVKIVKILLAIPGVDPEDKNGQALFQACRNNHREIVDVLLDIGNVDPSLDNSNALRVASSKGCSEIVRRLLADERVNPSAENDYSLRVAAKEGHSKIVKLLLKTGQVDPTVSENEPIRLSCKLGHAKVVKQLLACETVDPTVYHNAALLDAAENGHLKVVKMLLERIGHVVDIDWVINIAELKMAERPYYLRNKIQIVIDCLREYLK